MWPWVLTRAEVGVRKEYWDLVRYLRATCARVQGCVCAAELAARRAAARAARSSARMP